MRPSALDEMIPDRGEVKDVELDNLPVEHSILDQLQRRLKIAHEIDKEQHKVTKANSDEKWMRDAAEAMEVDLSDDMSECVRISSSCLLEGRKDLGENVQGRSAEEEGESEIESGKEGGGWVRGAQGST